MFTINKWTLPNWILLYDLLKVNMCGTHFSRGATDRASKPRARGSASGSDNLAAKTIDSWRTDRWRQLGGICIFLGEYIAGGSIFPGVVDLWGCMFSGFVNPGVTHFRGKLIRGVYASSVITRAPAVWCESNRGRARQSRGCKSGARVALSLRKLHWREERSR